MIGLHVALAFAAGVILGAAVPLGAALLALRHPASSPMRNAKRYTVPAFLGVVLAVLSAAGLLITCIFAIISAILG